MDELELSEVMHHGEDGGQTVIVVQGQHGEGEEVYPGFKFVSPAPLHHYASSTPSCQKSMIYVTSGSEARRALHGSEAESLGLPPNVFTATPSGATFLPPTLEMRSGVAREEDNIETPLEDVPNGGQSLAGTEISLMLGEEEVAIEEETEDESLLVSLTIPAPAFQFCPGCGTSLSSIEMVKLHCTSCLNGGTFKIHSSNKPNLKSAKGRKFDCSNCGKKFPVIHQCYWQIMPCPNSSTVIVTSAQKCQRPREIIQELNQMGKRLRKTATHVECAIRHLAAYHT